MSTRNSLLTLLRNGKSASCIWLSLGTPAIAEFAAETDVAAVVLDLQHGLWQRRDMEAAIGHIRHQSIPLARVPVNSPHAIGEPLDAGAMGVLVPIIETAEAAKAAVASAKYPPDGIRSGGGVRPLADFPAYVAGANKDILVGIMVETAKGVDHIDEIVKVPGIDMIFIGTGDLALSIGEFPKPGAGVTAAIDRIHSSCKTAGVPCGIFTGSPEDAAKRLAQGFRFVVARDDITLNRSGLKAAVSQLKA